MNTKHPVEAEFKYWARSDPPHPSEAISMVNGTHPGVQSHVTEVQDIRSCSEHFNLLDHGFQVIRHDSALLPTTQVDFDFRDPQEVKSRYWPELHHLITSELGPRAFVALESVVRESTPGPHCFSADGRLQARTTKPFHIVHNDFSPVGSRNLLRAVRPSFYQDLGCSNTVTTTEQKTFFNLRDEILTAEERAINESGCANHSEWDGANYKGPRWALFSIWRPLEPVKKDPLALLDPSSLFSGRSSYKERHEAYVSIPLPHRDREGLEDYIGANMMPLLPQPGQKHKWFWMSDQQPDEVFIIKLFDSEAWKTGSPVMPCSAHSAFEIPNTADSPSRKSIETRCVVVF